MSVLIKGMEMPKYCYICPAYDYIRSTCCVLHTEVKNLNDKRYKYCPLVEVPTPHGRLIDADDLDNITVVSFPNQFDPLSSGRLKKIIAPTIIEAEVSEE